MAQTLYFGPGMIHPGALALYQWRLAEIICHCDRMDDGEEAGESADRDAVPVVGPRGGVRRYSTVMFRDDVCEDVDMEDAIIARLDGPGDGDDERDDEGRGERDEEEDDLDADPPMFVGGVTLERYINEQQGLVYEDESDEEPLQPMTEREQELFDIVSALMGVETAEVARAEDRLLELCVVLDQMTAPTPESQTAEGITAHVVIPIDRVYEIDSDVLPPVRPGRDRRRDEVQRRMREAELIAAIDERLEADGIPAEYVHVSRKRDAEDPEERERRRRYAN
ncbi:hypothetical protein EPO33_00945 [Patescibacteria group bacterium]|nr:MAG: hypothetical protein EPO33_00945 [Patescibacteria group bacterium]